MNLRCAGTTNPVEQASIQERKVGPGYLRESARKTASFPHNTETSGGDHA